MVGDKMALNFNNLSNKMPNISNEKTRMGKTKPDFFNLILM